MKPTTRLGRSSASHDNDLKRMRDSEVPSRAKATQISWLIVALTAASMVIYFVTSLGVKGQVIFLIQAATKVLARLGVHP